jgi:hypothetical protein
LTFFQVAPWSALVHMAISPPVLNRCGPGSVGPMIRHRPSASTYSEPLS